MCFHTSWRLAALAFVTIAPIIYLTDQYARWSKKLQYEYWSALGDASAKASEAFGNIRTVKARCAFFGRNLHSRIPLDPTPARLKRADVCPMGIPLGSPLFLPVHTVICVQTLKAFSTEPQEGAGYKESTGLALSKAITDAIFGAATISFTNYLDLGGTVLILWYGGTLVLDGRLTVGTLVAFRLYWNMINGAYSSLMNLLSTLTRASGAASRVFPLLDVRCAFSDRKLHSRMPLVSTPAPFTARV
jgi:ABC-type multidrug transport system fused ATPase/permease subunit